MIIHAVPHALCDLGVLCGFRVELRLYFGPLPFFCGLPGLVCLTGFDGLGFG